MSIWSDLQDRSSGRVTRKEDEERDFVVNMDYASLYPRIILSTEDLKSTQIKLNHMSEELVKEINKLRWDLRKMKQSMKHVKCDYNV